MDKDSGASRASYDQLYKDLIKAFFADFLHLFDPDTAAGVDFSTLTFRDAEVFTDIPQGERRTADIVAEVRTKEGTPELVIVHVEIQRERAPHFERRMWEYFAALHLREKVPVIPIALIFYPGHSGIVREEYEVAVFRHVILSFRFLQISLPLLYAEEYVGADYILAAGLAAEMRLPPRRSPRVALLRRSLKRIFDAQRTGDLDEARAFLLWNAIQTYFRGHVEDQKELRVQLKQDEEGALMEATELTWAGEITLRALREALLDIVQAKFGQVSPDMQAVVDGAETEEALRGLIKRAATAQEERDLVQANRHERT